MHCFVYTPSLARATSGTLAEPLTRPQAYYLRHPIQEPAMIPIHKEPVGPSEESVWDYPRPPRLEDTPKHIEVIFNGVKIADTRRAKRVLETSHPPVYYIPPEDVKLAEYFSPTQSTTFCEWKGAA